MRKILALPLIACLFFSFNGCGGSKSKDDDNDSDSNQVSQNTSSQSQSGGTKKQGGGNNNSQSQSMSLQAPGGGGNQSGGGNMMQGGGQYQQGGGQYQQGGGQYQQGGGQYQQGGGQAGDQGSPEYMNGQRPPGNSQYQQGGGQYQQGGGQAGDQGSPEYMNGQRPPGSGQNQQGGGQYQQGGGQAGDQGSPEYMNGNGRRRQGGGGNAPSGPISTGSGGGNSGGGGSAQPYNGNAGGGQMSGDRRGGSGGSPAFNPGAGNSGAGNTGAGNTGAGSGTPAVPTKVSLKDRALFAFKQGDGAGGFQYMYGHYIAEDDGRSRIPLQFFTTVKRPRTAIRWGVGVVYSASGRVEGAPPKIGEQPNVLPQANSGRQNGRNNRNNRSGGQFGAGNFSGGAGSGSGGGQRNQGGPAPDGGLAELQYYTGEVGDTLLHYIDKQRKRGYYGKMVAKIPGESPHLSAPSAGGGGGNFNRGGGAGPQAFGSQGGGGGQQGQRGQLGFSSPEMGAGAGSGSTDSSQGQNRQAFGQGGAGGSFGAGGAGGNGGGGQGNFRGQGQPTLEATNTSKYKSVLPGVMMLGKGNLKSLQNRAKSNGIDILAVVEVKVKMIPSNGQIQNDTKIYLWDMTGEKPEKVGRPSTTLNNVRVWMARQRSTDEKNDPVRNGVKAIFEDSKEDGFANTYKIGEMPNLKQGHVLNRIKNNLISESKKSGNPLPALVEITYYREQGLLPERAYTEAVDEITNSKIGETLLNGTEDERVKALESLLPPNWKVPEVGGDEL